MAKRRRKRYDMAMPMPMVSTPKQQQKWSAESMARTVMDTDPKMKRVRDAITEAVESAAQKALGKGVKALRKG